MSVLFNYKVMIVNNLFYVLDVKERLLRNYVKKLDICF